MTTQVKYSNPIVQSFLHRRGLLDSDITYLLQPKAEHQHNPYLLKGIGGWIDKLHRAKGRSIAIVPDYDADGVLSGTLARVGLYLFGFGDVYVYPPKTCDGYGLSKQSVDAILHMRPDISVLITTDNGSNAHEGVRYAKEKGLTVLVTDHHLADNPPVADAVVNPNGHGDNTYPFTHISGTAVIYKVLAAYGHKYNRDPLVLRDFHALILLVGISTISDVMPLRDENRYYVTEAVKMLTYFSEGHHEQRVFGYSDSPLHQFYRGVDLLVMTLNRYGKLKYGIDADTFGFQLGPMLNSPRRMVGDSALAFELFQTRHQDVVENPNTTPSDTLYLINEQRKVYVQQLTRALFSYIEESGDNPMDHMVFNARMGSGLAGLLSGNFTKKYGLPSIAFGVGSSGGNGVINVPVSGDELLSGSARSPESFDLHGFLSMIDATSPGLIESWGGHAQAAGITIRAEHFNRFRDIFVRECMAILTQQDGIGPLQVFDGEYILTTDGYDHLTHHPIAHEREAFDIEAREDGAVLQHHALWDAVRFFEQLEPFGQGFSAPTFSVVISERDLSRVFYMGAEKQHVKLTLRNGLHVIHWNGAAVFQNGALGNKLLVVTGSLDVNAYNGSESLQLIADDVSFVDA